MFRLLPQKCFIFILYSLTSLFSTSFLIKSHFFYIHVSWLSGLWSSQLVYASYSTSSHMCFFSPLFLICLFYYGLFWASICLYKVQFLFFILLCCFNCLSINILKNSVYYNAILFHRAHIIFLFLHYDFTQLSVLSIFVYHIHFLLKFCVYFVFLWLHN